MKSIKKQNIHRQFGLILIILFQIYSSSYFYDCYNENDIKITQPDVPIQRLTNPILDNEKKPNSALARQWTFMVYMDADNNLEAEGIAELNQIEMVGSTNDVAFVVELDRRYGYDTSNGDWTDTRRYFVTVDTDPNIINSNGITIGEANMGQADTLRDFITYSQINYPAENYALIIWDHGSGIQYGNQEGGVCWDDGNGGDYLTIQEIQIALTGKNIDLLAFETCLTGASEFYYALHEYSSIIVASEDLLYSWPMYSITYSLSLNPSMKPAQLGSIIVDKYIEYYIGFSMDITLSVINSSVMPSVFSATSELATILMNNIGLYYSSIGSVLNFANYYNGYEFTDLYTLADLIEKTIPSVTTECNNLKTAIDSAVLDRGNLSSPNSYGMSIYCPRTARYFYSTYANNMWSVDGTWDDFLLTYFSWGSGGIPGSDDVFENNDNLVSAAPISAEIYHLIFNDDDYYSINVSTNEIIDLYLNFTYITGTVDLDMELFDASNTKVVDAITLGNMEAILFNNTASSQAFKIHIFNQHATYNISYTLSIAIHANDDLYEENDNLIDAKDITSYVNNTIFGLQALDLDFFKFTTCFDAYVNILLEYQANEGYLTFDLLGYNSSGGDYNQFASISSTGDNCQYYFSTFIDNYDVYFIKVINYENNSNYNLTLYSNTGLDDTFDRNGNNDQFNEAKIISDGTYQNLYCIDYDMYNISLVQDQWLNVSIFFQSKYGDLDLYLFNPDQIEVASSIYWGDREMIIYEVPISGIYTILVKPNAVNPSYKMKIDRTLQLENDIYDGMNENLNQNATFSTFIVDSLHEDLTGWDNDWFKICLNAGETISILVLYSKLTGILIPKIYNSTGSLLQFIYTNGKNERLNFTAPSNGVYYLCIYAVQRCSNYDLFIFANPIQMDFSITTTDLTISLTELVPLNVGIMDYNWNYGDGNQYSGLTANRSYTYTANGTYAVSLKIHLLGDLWYEYPTKFITVNKTIVTENITTPNDPSNNDPLPDPNPPSSNSSNTDNLLNKLLGNQNLMIILGCFIGGVVIITIIPKKRRNYLSDLKR